MVELKLKPYVARYDAERGVYDVYSDARRGRCIGYAESLPLCEALAETDSALDAESGASAVADADVATGTAGAQNLTGMIVVVEARNGPVCFLLGGQESTLQPGEQFIGYFGQMTGQQADGRYTRAHIRQTILTDSSRRLCRYGEEAVFYLDEVVIRAHALRGPHSNNRYLPAHFKKLETWHLAQD